MSPEAQRITIAEGVKVGRLTAIKEAGKSARNRMVYWDWACDCGTKKTILVSSVKSGHTLSCGCLRREKTTQAKTIHGNAKRKQHTAEYRSWRGILTRCYNAKCPYYGDYGGRGITVCDRWINSFLEFLKDMGPKPSPSHSIDRRDNDRGYSPENCRWATPKEQSNNRRNRRWKAKP